MQHQLISFMELQRNANWNRDASISWQMTQHHSADNQYL